MTDLRPARSEAVGGEGTPPTAGPAGGGEFGDGEPAGEESASGGGTEASVRLGSISRRLSVATRVALVIVGVAIASLVTTAVVGLVRGTALAEAEMEQRLATITSARSDDLARHFEGLRSRLGSLAASAATADAIDDFAAATDELDADPPAQRIVDELTEYYVDVVVPPLAAVRGDSVSQSALLPVTDSAISLQSTWTVVEDGEDPAAVDDAGDGTAWSDVHVQFHPAYRKFATQAGFDDLVLVDTNERVVYSVNKGIDLGTSLRVGPHSGGVLSEVVAGIRANPQPGQVVVGDMSLSTVAGGRPVGVVASPVFMDDRFAGVVAGTFEGDTLTDIMTNDRDWGDLGDTGQSYLVGADGTMRSDDRLFLQDRTAWLEESSSLLTDEQARAISALDTTVALAPVDEQLLLAASDGEPGIARVRGPTGTDVEASYRSLSPGGLDWVAVTQLDVVEGEAPLRGFVRNLFVAMALFVVAVAFVGVAWANRFTAPLRAASERLRVARLRDRVDDRDMSVDLVSDAPLEYEELSSDIDRMLGRLAQRQRDVEQRAAERVQLLRQFLPSTVVHRAEAGEQDVVDQAQNASVAVVVLRGLGDLVRTGDKEETRDLLAQLVDELDALAVTHGVERLRLGGDTYHAVSGASRPLLDHAPRAATFALAARDLVDDFGGQEARSIRAAVGLASGPVTVGLTSGARLVFDGWGPTVDRAGQLARAAADGQVLTDDSTTARLPDEFVTSEAGVDDDVVALAIAVDGGEQR